MTSLTAVPLAEVLGRLAAPTAAPGGGAAAALAGALGAAVGTMVASLPQSRHGTAEERGRLDAAAVTLAGQRITLAGLADADTTAVLALMAAVRRERAGTGPAPAAAVATATHEATRVPLETARLCREAIDAVRDVAACGVRVAASDVFVAITLLEAAANAAAANVRANLATLDDEPFVRESTRQLTRTLDGVARGAHAALAALQD